MKFDTNKEKGNTGLGMAIAYYTEDKSMYIIPKEKIKNKTTLNICEKYSKYRVCI